MVGLELVIFAALSLAVLGFYFEKANRWGVSKMSCVPVCTAPFWC